VSTRAAPPGILHGMRSLLLSDDDGQVFPAHSISASSGQCCAGAALDGSAAIPITAASERHAVMGRT